MYTEDEAKKKWCPFGGNPTILSALCQASECMMWKDEGLIGEYASREKHGYCGLSK